MELILLAKGGVYEGHNLDPEAADRTLKWQG